MRSSPQPPQTNAPSRAAKAAFSDSFGPVDARVLRGRATQAVVWGMPAVNFELLYDALVKAGGDWNQTVYWSKLSNWRNQTLTPNPDVIYVFPFYDTRNGPMVLDIPPAEGSSTITGSVDDAWQTAIEDVGPAGVDKGKGGKYLITPPGYTAKVPKGYTLMRSSTFAGMVILRSNIGSGSAADIAKAVEYGKRVKLYALSQAANPPATRFVDAIDKVYDNTIPYDLRFFEKLHAFVQREPWLERDRSMIDVLRSIGIEKGKPFRPDAAIQALLKEGVADAHAWLDEKYQAAFTPYYDDHQWALPALPEAIEGMSTNFVETNSYAVDARGMMYTYGYFSAKHLGQGQFYLMTTKDKEGQSLDGSNTYRLNVPPNAPVSLYWSATVYDRATHALIREQKWSSRASTTQGMQKNPDGSVEVYFGPQPPAGKDSNWVPTVPNRRFEVLFRFYGPEKAVFDKTWVLPDIEKIH
jgi:hypothetical protein